MLDRGSPAAAAISSDVDIDYDAGWSIDHADPGAGRHGCSGPRHIQCMLISLPPQDTLGRLRAADGKIHLWATLRESPSVNEPG
jgi:hypothetical protein